MGRNNEDFSHGSSYWNDKSYGDVAPDGTVHPARAGDRVGDAYRHAEKYGGKYDAKTKTYYQPGDNK